MIAKIVVSLLIIIGIVFVNTVIIDFMAPATGAIAAKQLDADNATGFGQTQVANRFVSTAPMLVWILGIVLGALLWRKDIAILLKNTSENSKKNT